MVEIEVTSDILFYKNILHTNIKRMKNELLWMYNT